MIKTMVLSAAVLACVSTVSFAEELNSVQGRPSSGLASNPVPKADRMTKPMARHKSMKHHTMHKTR